MLGPAGGREVGGRSRESGAGGSKCAVTLCAGRFRRQRPPLLREGVWLGGCVGVKPQPASLLAVRDDLHRQCMNSHDVPQVKCIPFNSISGDSCLVDGLVCRKNVAHRRMRTHIERPRILMLRGALENRRASTNLSSFDTMLDQVRGWVHAVSVGT